MELEICLVKGYLLPFIQYFQNIYNDMDINGHRCATLIIVFQIKSIGRRYLGAVAFIYGWIKG